MFGAPQPLLHPPDPPTPPGLTSSMPETADNNGRASDESDRGPPGGGNRWPRQETLALIKIRTDMDSSFRDSNLKGPLWEEVERKMSAMGYNRRAKKCREKFENVYKYHKRTKEGRSSKSDSKTYRFFDELEALFTRHYPPSSAVPISVAMPPRSSPSASSSTSLSTSSDEQINGGASTARRRKKRKRKWKGFFEKLMKQVTAKQEDLQRKFLDAVEERERVRAAREEDWKIQEAARLNRHHDLLLQERSISAAKDAALVSYLQKLSENNHQIPIPIPIQTPIPIPLSIEATPDSASASRWPKAEVEALINLRSRLDEKYEEGGGGVKGPLWEEISMEMKKIGYNRNAKRCKEKWENINKYFKKVKESDKKRPEDSKTCPYFHQLDALYRRKNKNAEAGSKTVAETPESGV